MATIALNHDRRPCTDKDRDFPYAFLQFCRHMKSTTIWSTLALKKVHHMLRTCFLPVLLSLSILLKQSSLLLSRSTVLLVIQPTSALAPSEGPDILSLANVTAATCVSNLLKMLTNPLCGGQIRRFHPSLMYTTLGLCGSSSDCKQLGELILPILFQTQLSAS